RFELTLSLAETAGGLETRWEYNTELFDRVTVERLAAAFARLLAGALAAPEARLSELPLLSGEERRQVLEEWSRGAFLQAPTVALSEPAVRRSRQTPERVAAVFGDSALSYGELERRSWQLAAHLRAQGVRPGDLVGLCVERSLELLQGMLGI